MADDSVRQIFSPEFKLPSGQEKGFFTDFISLADGLQRPGRKREAMTAKKK